jgi:4-alpha-glucanotransferase
MMRAMDEIATFHRLAALYGVEETYVDSWGQPRIVPETSRRALLAAMDADPSSAARLASAVEEREALAWRQPLEPVQVVAEGTQPLRVPIVLPAAYQDQSVSWTLELEERGAEKGAFRFGDLPVEGAREVDGAAMERRVAALAIAPPMGYHRLSIACGGHRATTRLVVAPTECYLPPPLESGGRVWGIAAQLYGLRSKRNWGIGDFTDLGRFCAIAAKLGASAVGLNPLHAVFPGRPERFGPFAPSSRLFRNVLYVDVGAVAEYKRCAEARAMVEAEDFQAALAALRETELIDYPAVAARKMPVLELLYATFRAAHVEPKSGLGRTARGRAFRRYQAEAGAALERQATFEALAEHLGGKGGPDYHWREWAEEFRHAASPAVAEFARQRRERVEFFQYLQWQAELQMRKVVARCRRLGMPIGLYHDLALGFAGDGGDAWSYQDTLAAGMSVGAPPETWNPKGQDWGLPPFDPHKLRAAGYEPYIDTLRAIMRQGGALRIDHVLGHVRQYWIPFGMTAVDGGYVKNQLDDLLGILALESRRNRCLVVGEDLGTVPHGLRERLARHRILSYRLLYFERDEHGELLPPGRFPPLALIGLGTHDMPTLAGFWLCRDLDWRRELALFPTPELKDRAYREREHDRRVLPRGLAREGLFDESKPATDQDGRPSWPLIEGMHRYLARSRPALMMLHVEDLLGAVEQVNLPATVDEHPNWRRKQPIALERLPREPRISALADICAERRFEAPKKKPRATAE